MERDVRATAPVRERTPFFGIALGLSLAAAAFFSGIEVGSHSRMEASLGSLFAASPERTVEMEQFWRVWDLLDEKFVSGTTTEPVSDEEKVYGAIRGLVGSYGDPYTSFLPPADAEIFESDISGNFEGVGMEVGIRDGIVTVIAPLPETPAAKAGIEAGDAIIRIDDKPTDGMSVDEAVKLIRGEKGTTVVLTIFRDEDEGLRDISVVRDTINIPTLTTETRDGVFIIKLFNFSALAEARMQTALREFMESGSDKLIIDLRGNPGGFLQSAVHIAGYFLPTGKVVVRESFGDGTERPHRSNGRNIGAYRDFETVVLVDKGSASASEILAGALSEHGVATLVGEPTFGKGSVQELVELSDGSSLKVTVARWLTPNGISISEGGLAPEVVVEVTVEDREAGRDPQLEAAIEHLQK